MKHSTVAFSGCTCTVFGGCCDNIPDWITCVLNMSSVDKIRESLCWLFSGCGINAFRMASRYSSRTAKFCACVYIEFLAGIFSWPVDSTLLDSFPLRDLLVVNSLCEHAYLLSVSVLPPNVVVERLALLLRILEIRSSNLDPATGYPEFFVAFLSPSRQMPDSMTTASFHIPIHNSLIFYSTLYKSKLGAGVAQSV
jgi:hypothetical protein